eukprot:6211165-Pleurochrysis_carterae.AAC.4
MQLSDIDGILVPKSGKVSLIPGNRIPVCVACLAGISDAPRLRQRRRRTLVTRETPAASTEAQYAEARPTHAATPPAAPQPLRSSMPP